MPRFLNTWTGEFEWHSDPKQVRYAILSHVWQTPKEGGEQSFADVQRIQADVEAAKNEPSGPFPTHWIFDTMKAPFPYDPSGIFSDLTLSDVLDASLPEGLSVIFSAESPLSDKIKGLCKVAREAGFHLVWNDTCCIDKSSSAELSEAINSMYQWYRLSDMCYAYLADVPDGEISSANQRLRWSQWHGRGWTLQELIAPERIQFLTWSWRFLGTKLGLAVTLADITNIDVNILLGRASVDSASVAQRMSWAAPRETTRVEDQAYSLMGIFGVHMSPIYGEGTNAFFRLQEEVIRSIPDQSIFAWGSALVLTVKPGAYNGRFYHTPNTKYYAPSLLAPSLDLFSWSTVRPIALSDFASRLRLHGLGNVPPLDCVFAPQGTRVRLLCLNMTDPEMRRHFESVWPGQEQSCKHGPSLPVADRLALLQCEDKHRSLVALPVCFSDTGHGSLVGTRRTPCMQSSCSHRRQYRAFRLPQGMLAEILKGIKLEMVEVCFLSRCPDPRPSKLLLRLAHSEMLPALDLWSGDCPGTVAFSLSPDSVANLQMLGVTASPLLATRKESQITLETTLALRSGDLHSTGTTLRISIEQKLEASLRLLTDKRKASDCDNVKFCFVVASSASLTTDLVSAVPGSDREQIHGCTDIVASRYTLAQCDFLIRTCPERPQRVRTLRLSLDRSPNHRTHPPANSRTVFLVLETSEEYEHTPEANRIPEKSGETATGQADSEAPEKGGTSEVNNGSATPLAPSHFSDVVYPPTNARTKQGAALEERVDALGQENSALRAQVSAVAEQTKSEVAVLAGRNTALAEQNAALATKNAALEAQMAAMCQRIDALAASATATPSPPPASTLRRSVRRLLTRAFR